MHRPQVIHRTRAGTRQPAAEYTFSNSSPEALTRLRLLESAFDDASIEFLTRIPLPKGVRCWEVGAGAGSIARHLRSRVLDLGGRLVTTDLDPCLIVHERDLVVQRHDIRTEAAPDGGPFDLIHARLVLGHLPERVLALTSLVDALSPGGWLVLEEIDGTSPQTVLQSRTAEDARLFERVSQVLVELLSENGADPSWADQVCAEMVQCGLNDIRTVVQSETWSGASAGCRLLAGNARHLRPRLVAAGIDTAEVERFDALMLDESFAATSLRMVRTAGRRTAPALTREIT